MPYKRKDSPIWWASFVDQNGKRVRQSTGTADRKEAEAIEAKWKVGAFRARTWDEAPDILFEEVLTVFLRSRQDARSFKDFRLHGRRLLQSFSKTVMNGLSAAMVSAYVRKRQGENVSNATINRELAVLSAAINHYNREFEMTLPNPVMGRLLKEREGRLRWLTREEADALVHAAEQYEQAGHLPPLIRLALNTGMRRGEMLGLEWRRVDLKGNMIHLEGAQTKSGKRRSIPLNKEAREAVVDRARYRATHCPASRWVFVNSDGERIKDVKRSFNTACKRAGIEDFRFHDLRHTCAAWLVTKGVPLAEVRDLLGHSTVIMTERYAHLAPENVRSAVALLDTDAGSESRSGHAQIG